MSDDRNPNQYKNRIPTATERAFLVDMIKQQEEEISNINEKILVVKIEIDQQKIAVQDCQSILAIAQEVEKLARLKLKLVMQMSDGMMRLQEIIQSRKVQPNQPPGTMYLKVLAAKDLLEERQQHDLMEAQSMVEAASRNVYELEEEVDANKSMLAFSTRSVALLVDLADRITAEITLKKELLGARRRVPAELWAQIFVERVIEDEETYRKEGREGSPPFTALKLSAVCRLWRFIIQNQPKAWRYIAIPRAVEISRAQWDRVDHHRILVRGLSPTVYIVPDSRGGHRSTLRQSLLLQRFTQFRCLELRVSRRTTEAEDLLAAIQPRVGELVLIGSIKQGSPGTSCPLTYKAIKNVQTIRCIDLHPSMRLSSPHTQQLPIISAHFKQTYLESRNMAQFIEALPKLTSLTIELYWTCTIDTDGPRSPATFGNLTNINASVAVLSAVFTDEVTLPALRHITLQLTNQLTGEDVTHWVKFVSLHQRSSTIERLTLLMKVREPEPIREEILQNSHTCMRLIQAVSGIRFLELEGDVVSAVLAGSTLSKTFPSKLQEISIVRSSVTEEHVEGFLKAYYANKRPVLVLHLEECSNISAFAKARLVESPAGFGWGNGES